MTKTEITGEFLSFSNLYLISFFNHLYQLCIVANPCQLLHPCTYVIADPIHIFCPNDYRALLHEVSAFPSYKMEILLAPIAPLKLAFLTMATPAILPSLPFMQFNSDIAQLFPGLQERFQEFSKQSFDFPDEVIDDMDGEQETLAVRTESDAVDGEVEGEQFLDEEYGDSGNDDVPMSDSTAQPATLISGNSTDLDSTGLRHVLMEASKGVSEGTHSDYKR